MAIGFITFLLLWPYAEYELRSDRYHNDEDRIVRLGVDFKWTDDNQNWNGFLGAFNWWGVASEISKSFSGVENITRLANPMVINNKFGQNLSVSIIDKAGEKTIHREANAILADPNLFNFFTIPLLEGDANHLIDEPNTVVLSETCSRKYFGIESALDKTLFLYDSIPVKVTGVFRDLPQNTHLRFDMVFSVAGRQNLDIPVWGSGWAGYCYIKLRKDYSLENFRKDIDDRKAALYAFVKSGCPHCDMASYIQPLHDVVFSNLRGNTFHSKSKFLLECLYAVSFLVLLLGWINYVSLSIHSLNKRLAEMATRKVVGAQRNDLAIQFVVESLIVNCLSFLAALTLFQLFKNQAEQVLGLYIPTWHELSGAALLTISLTFLGSVLLPPIYLLSIIQRRSVSELFKKSKYGIKHSFVNTGLVTIQYTSAIVLLILILISSSQLTEILKKDIGIKRDGVVVVEGPAQLRPYEDSKITSFLLEAKKIKGINKSTVSHSLVGEPDVPGLVVQRNMNSNYVGVDTNGGVDENFLETFQVKLLAGRNFLADNPADRNTILISQALVKRLGFPSPEEAVGKRLLLPDFNKSDIEIIGVISDYEFRPYFFDLSERHRGVALMYKDFLVPYFKPLKLSFNIEFNEFKSTITKMEQLYQSFFPEETFKWYWLNEKIEGQYLNEKRAYNQIGLFTALAIGIACLGLLGLTNNKIIEKTKEIGIRKVLGARMYQIAHLLLHTTSRQVLIATVVAIPISYYLAEQYLQKFSERISLSWWYFALPVALLSFILLATVASVVWKAASNNPVEALKHE